MATLKALSTLRSHNPHKVDVKSSIYYYWFEFLKRSKSSDRSKKVREDFGDVNNVEFMEWWRYTGQKLFLIDHGDGLPETPTMGILDLESAQESLDAGRFMVSIDMAYPKKVIMDRLKGIVDRMAVAKVGRRKFNAENVNGYHIESKFEINALIKTLAVYDLRMNNEELSLWEIEEQVKYEVPVMARNKVRFIKMVGLIDKTSADEDSIWHPWNKVSNEAAKRKVQTVTVSRYFRHAEEIIENVAKHGKFPVHGR